MLRHISFLKLAEEEGATILPDRSDEAVFALGVPEVVLTLGSEGSVVYAGGRVTRVPCHPIHGVDLTGCGDASVGYLAARSDGLAPVAAARRATALVALLLSTRKRARRRRLEAELSPGDDDRRAAHLHALDGVGRTVDPRVQQRRPRDLGPLLDLDLDAPGDPAMPSEMQRERSAADPVAGSS